MIIHKFQAWKLRPGVLKTAIGRVVINEDDLEVGVGLVEDRGEAGINVLHGVIADDDDGDGGIGVHPHLDPHEAEIRNSKSEIRNKPKSPESKRVGVELVVHPHPNLLPSREKGLTLS